MITILKSGYWNIMRLFYRNKVAHLHLREIARQTGLHGPSATRFLNSLETEHILRSERDGILKKYSINKSIKAYFIFELFDLERFEKLPSTRKTAIKIYFNNLSDQPIFAILFGSTAKGTYTEDSDIDILLITNRRISSEKAQKEVDTLTAMRVSTFQITYKDFLIELKMKEDKVVQSAIQSGYPLINHISYYLALHS